jgi:hypothetical protein
MRHAQKFDPSNTGAVQTLIVGPMAPAIVSAILSCSGRGLSSIVQFESRLARRLAIFFGSLPLLHSTRHNQNARTVGAGVPTCRRVEDRRHGKAGLTQ